MKVSESKIEDEKYRIKPRREYARRVSNVLGSEPCAGHFPRLCPSGSSG